MDRPDAQSDAHLDEAPRKPVWFRATALYYHFRSEDEHDTFDRAAPLSITLGPFSCTLEAGLLKAVPTQDFDELNAMAALQPHLDSWKEHAYLTPSRHRIRFDYERADLEAVGARPGDVYVFPGTARAFATTLDAAISRDNAAYPAPDETFRSTPLTEHLTKRFRNARESRAHLPGEAYFILEAIQHSFGGTRQSAARQLAVSGNVLDRLGNLSNRTDPLRGRHAGAPVPLSARELEWIEAVVVRLIRRVGERAAGVPLRQLTMSDFPSLG